jgi:hypothetical protein
MDSSGVPIVSINGAPANMKARSAQAAEFWSDPVNLKTGENSFEIVATNSAKMEARFHFLARFQPPAPPPAPAPQPAPPPNPKALSKGEIMDLLSNYVPSARVAELVRDRGIKFTPTVHDVNDISEAGGDADLIAAIKQTAAKQ